MSNFVHPVRPHIRRLAEALSVSLAPPDTSKIRVFGNLNVNWITAEMLAPSRWEIARHLLSGHFKEQFFKSAAYPSPKDHALLVERLAGLYGVDAGDILLTAGADEAIQMISQVFCENERDQVITHPPTYWSYSKYTNRAKGSILAIPLIETENDFTLDKSRILEAIERSDGSIKVINIVNPNNPTGSYFSEDDIVEIIRAAEQKGITVVLDEAYIEIAQKPSFVPKLESHPNLLILRTGSKAYGLAGERVGVIICKNPELRKCLQQVSPLFSVTSSAIQNFLRATHPSRQRIVEESWRLIAEHRDAVIRAVENNDSMRAYRSRANLLLIGVEDAQRAFDKFIEIGILPANPALFGFTDKIRLSLGGLRDTPYLVDVIENMDLRRG